MSKINYNLLQLDVDKLFEERHINEIIEVEKHIDVEIEKKRVELRCMVGDKYKDILAASDAINTMQDISQKIVEDISQIREKCDVLVISVDAPNTKNIANVDAKKLEDRSLIAQIRLTILLNEQVWSALDDEDYSRAAQLYLLAQHVHTGLRLLGKDILDRIPLLKQIKGTLENLRERIVSRVKEKLESLETTAEIASSNLNALMLLESQTSSELLRTFITLRETALINVIQKMHSSAKHHASVRHQLAGMVKCLTTTVHLLHNCFISYNGLVTGLIWQQLESVVNENSPSTLSKVALPKQSLLKYLPKIISQFRPKCIFVISKEWTEDLNSSVSDWLKHTSETINRGIGELLELITSVKGLHIIREEALKISVPQDWDTICSQANLPTNFNIWYYFFQSLITEKAVLLISRKVKSNIESLQEDIVCLLKDAADSKKPEFDLRWYTWHEDADDVSRVKNVHIGLSLKTRGYSDNIIKLCDKNDASFLDILNDMSYYLCGKEYDNSKSTLKLSTAYKHDRKYSDREKLQNHRSSECNKNITCGLVKFLEKTVNSEDKDFILKSLLCARILQAIAVLCQNLKRCCSTSNADEWERVRSTLIKASLDFWNYWKDDVIAKLNETSSQIFDTVDMVHSLRLFHKWDTIEIQEQTEEQIFKSQIKVPFQLSSSLLEILNSLSTSLSQIVPHTLPKSIHMQLIEGSVKVILTRYEKLSTTKLNQKQALQFLFDIRFLMLFCVPRENMKLVQQAQEICDKLRANIDPFDLDVFYSYLQRNVKQTALQTQVILGCILPNSGQLSSLGILEKNKEHEKDPSIFPLSTPTTSSWFSLLPVTAPIAKTAIHANKKEVKNSSPKSKPSKKSNDPSSAVRSSAAALFGAMGW